MDEGRILSTSQPFIIVRFIGSGGMYVSTTYEVANDQESDDYSDVIGSGIKGNFGYKPGIISLTTEGVASIARKATIRFADPTTYVTRAVLASSTWSNSVRGRGKANIAITFGWKYLLPVGQTAKYYTPSSQWPNKSQKVIVSGVSVRADQNVISCEVDGMMMKTKFEINAQGVTEVEIEVMEVSGPIYGTASFLDPIDIMNWKKTYDNDVKNGNDPIAAVQKFINESRSLKLTTGDGKIPSIQFEFSNEGFKNTNNLSIDWKGIFSVKGATNSIEDAFGGIKIQYQESFETFINEIFSKIPDRNKIDSNNGKQVGDPGSYEIESVYRAGLDPKKNADNDTYKADGVTIDHPGTNPTVTWIKYNWKKSITYPDGSPAEGISSRPPSFTFKWGNEGIWDEDSQDGIDQYNQLLQGKKSAPQQEYSRRGAKKFLINWSSDLSSKSYLHFMATSELQKALKSYNPKVMEYVIEQLQNGATISEDGNYTVTTPSPAPGSAPKDSAAQPLDITSDGISYVQKGFSAAVKAATASASGGSSAQLASIVGNNMFKATATVMGDPDIGGPLFTPYKTTIRTSFDTTYFQDAYIKETTIDTQGIAHVIYRAAGASDNTNLNAFNKVWLITKVHHKIEAGSYTTDVEMITYPNL